MQMLGFGGAATAIAIAFIACMFLIVIAAPAEGADIYVDDEASSSGAWWDYNTISSAISGASAGDTIYVYAGSYSESPSVNKALTIIGNGTTDTTVNGGNSGDVFSVSANNVTISGFKLAGTGTGAYDAGVELTSVYDCRVEYTNSSSINGVAALLQGAINCNVENNTAVSTVRNSILVRSISKRNIIRNNEIFSGSSNGILVEGSSTSNILDNNTLAKSGTGINLWQAGGNTVTGNDCYKNTGQGIDVSDCSGNMIGWNVVSDNTAYGIRIHTDASSHIVHNNTVTGNGNSGVLINLRSTSNTIKDNLFTGNTEDGIQAWTDCDSNTVQYNNCSSNSRNGILLGYAENNTIADNEAYHNTNGGVKLQFWSWNNIVTRNTLNRNMFGVWVTYVNLTTITENTCSLNTISGIRFLYGNRSSIENNTLTANTDHGLYLSDSSVNNDVRWNNISDNGGFGDSLGQLNEGLIGYWKLDTGSGTTATDTTGTSDGTISGAAWTTGQFSNALDLDGSNDYVNIPHDSSQNPDHVTAMAWVNIDGSTGDHQVILSKWADRNNGQSDEFSYVLELNPDGRTARWTTRIGSTTDVLLAPDQFDLDTWVHLAGTFDGSMKRLYVNGVEVASVAASGTLGTCTNDLRIGAHDYSGDYNWLDGTVDDVRVYNWSLDAGDIASIYAAGAGIDIQSSVTDCEFTNNTITDNKLHGVVIDSTSTSGIGFHYNDISGNGHGLNNTGTVTVDAERNWWGEADGPSGVGTGAGDIVTDHVDYEPWYATPTVTPSTEYVTVTYNPTKALSDTIQGGIDAASTGDNVEVSAGTYFERPYITTTINLRGAGAGNTTINGSGLSDILYVTANWVNISGFLITDGGSSWGDASVQFHGTVGGTVEETACSYSYVGVISVWSSRISINNSELVDNHQNGIWLYGSTAHTITGNNCSGNYDGIYLEDGDNSYIENNSIDGNSNYGIYITSSSSGNEVHNNTLMGNTGGTIYNNDPWDVNAQYNYWGTIAEATIQSDIYDDADDGSKGVVYYSPWWDASFTTLYANDIVAPVTTDDYDGQWHNSDVTITLTPTDSESGVSETYWRVNGGAWNTGTTVVVSAPSDHSMDGNNTLEYGSIDNVGNNETVNTVTVRIDTTCPEIRIFYETSTDRVRKYPIDDLDASPSKRVKKRGSMRKYILTDHAGNVAKIKIDWYYSRSNGWKTRTVIFREASYNGGAWQNFDSGERWAIKTYKSGGTVTRMYHTASGAGWSAEGNYKQSRGTSRIHVNDDGTWTTYVYPTVKACEIRSSESECIYSMP